jgi:glyoxylase-like metal-dependent hydrolase (beta-lactamase superfamily II)/rhodanese-related sulfurtransferase
MSGSMTVEQLHQKMSHGDPVFILDVRNPEDYNEWKIEGRNIQSMNIPYFDFLDEDETVYKDLPKDTEIIVVCAKSGSSEMVADMLEEKGYDVKSLKEGMRGWSQLYVPVTITVDENMKLVQFNRLAKGCLSYMVISEGNALVVDPGRSIGEYIVFSQQENVKIAHVVDTHLHADHISGGIELARKTGATYYISSGEMQGSDRPYEPLEKHSHIQFGSVDVEVLAMPTPGHTPGSTSFLVNRKFLLSGDTIFVGGLGRPDLGGKAREWAQALYDTVFKKIADLPDDVLVLPGHYADIKEINENGYVGATLGDIRRSNEIMRTTDVDQFTERVVSAVGETPPNYERIVEINRGTEYVREEEAIDLEIGPNRCAVHHQ